MNALLAVFKVPGTGFEIPPEILVIGVITGLTYGLTAVGLVMVYRVSRVINFAHGALGALPALLVPVLVFSADLPYVVSLPLALAVGAGGGALLERMVVRRLTNAPRLIVMVATIAFAQILGVVGALAAGDRDFLREQYPTPFSISFDIGDLRMDSAKLLVILVAPLCVLAFAFYQRKTPMGIAGRAAADNADAAWLTGIPVKRVSMLAWSTAGLFAAASAILVGATRPIGASAAAGLGAGLLVRALAAALVGRLDNVGQAFGAGIAIGVVESLLTWNYTTGGHINIVLLVLVMGCLLFRKGLAQAVRAGASAQSLGGDIRALPPVLRAHPFVKYGRWLLVAIALWVPVLLSFDMTTEQHVLLSGLVIFATMGLSLVVLTGFAGQVSLGQATFVGLGAFIAGRTWDLGFPPLAVLGYVILITAGTALLIGLPALRVRGLFLAVATLAFAVFAEGWLFSQSWLTESNGRRTETLPRTEILGIDMADEKHYAWMCLFFFVVTALGVYRIRTTGVGRQMIAVRDNEPAASTLGLSPRRVKLMAFSVAGGIAGLSGWLYGGLLVNFAGKGISGPDESIQLVVMAVLGGVTTITGAILGALWVKGIPYFASPNIALFSSAAGVLFVILYLQGGLATLAFRIRDRVVTWATGMKLDEVVASAQQSGRVRATLPPSPELVRSDEIVLRAEGIRVSYGGNVVLNGIDIELQRGEVLGILGPNGAGKTTLFDVLNGHLKPDSGRIILNGQDVTSLRAEERAGLLMGRTFQQARLFDELTLFECLQVALERDDPTEFVPSFLGLPPSRKAERAKSIRAGELIELLGLEPYANRPMTALSTGTRRMAELAAMVALGAKVVLLDEPTAGVAQAEVERFTPVIREIARHLGASLIVIEHDIPLMMSLVDRLYVLAAGEVLAEGEPEVVGTDPAVIAAYLGTDERAVNRSGKSAQRVPAVSGPASVAASASTASATTTAVLELDPEPLTGNGNGAAAPASRRRPAVQDRIAAQAGGADGPAPGTDSTKETS